MPKLYDLAAQYADVSDRLIEAFENGSEYVDFDGIKAELDASKEDLAIKLENCARLIRNLEADANAFRIEKERLERKEKGAASAVKWLKDYMRAAMEIAKVSKLRAGIFEPRLQKNGQCSVECNAKIADLPAKFVRTVPEKKEIDKEVILAAWKAGEKLPAGVIVVQGQHVRF